MEEAERQIRGNPFGRCIAGNFWDKQAWHRAEVICTMVVESIETEGLLDEHAFIVRSAKGGSVCDALRTSQFARGAVHEVHGERFGFSGICGTAGTPSGTRRAGIAPRGNVHGGRPRHRLRLHAGRSPSKGA
mmetsp:Transcript_38546/g.111173  ORF Transcript_38546/g.111173 Transcript_38546/m.111173 type:complete len:132 (-) Transcript_38546:383-778(-)